MKRIATLALAAAFTLGSLGAAHAVEVKVKGTWDFAFGLHEHVDLYNNDHGGTTDNTVARQRFRTQVEFIASEALSGVLMFEIGTIDWGRGGTNGQSSGGQLDADGVNVETKRAYLDWVVPGSDLTVRMGLQGLALPMGTGYSNPVFSADVAAIVANYKFNDMVSLTAFWARPFDRTASDNIRNSDGNRLDDEVDVIGAILPITGDGWKVTPWAMGANVGNESGVYGYLQGQQDYDQISNTTDRLFSRSDSVPAWWTGVAFELTILDPLTFGFDAMYGDMHRNNVDGMFYGFANNDYVGTRGWFIDGKLDYKFDWGTIGLLGWWSSGDSEAGLNAGQYGRAPVLGVDDGYGVTSFGFPGSAGIGDDTIFSLTPMGTWGVGLEFADVSFIEDLSHTLRVAYYTGTNEHKIIQNGRDIPFNFSAQSYDAHGTTYLTDKDYAIEVNFDHKYQIYENLAAYLELGYLHINRDDDVWGNVLSRTSDAWKGEVLFKYSF